MILDADGETLLLRYVAGRRRRLARLVDPGAAAALLPWATIEHLIATDAVASRDFQIVLNGFVVRPDLYRDRQSNALNEAAVRALIAQGVTVVIDRINRLVPGIAQQGERLGEALGVPVNVNCYISYGERQGVKLHADPHDVVAVQVHGAKHWLGHGPAGPDWVNEAPGNEARPVVWEETLSAGNVLYLPKGEIHAALPIERPSVHLAFGFKAKPARAA